MPLCEGIGVLVKAHKVWVEKLRFVSVLFDIAGCLTLGKSFIFSKSLFITSKIIIIISIQLMRLLFEDQIRFYN